MEHPQDLDRATAHTIGDDVARARHGELTSAGQATRTADTRMLAQFGHGPHDA